LGAPGEVVKSSLSPHPDCDLDTNLQAPGWGGAAPRGGSGGGSGGREMQGAVVKEEKGRKSMDGSNPDYVFEAGASGLGYYRAHTTYAGSSDDSDCEITAVTHVSDPVASFDL
jgi:hypothetical protein